MMDPNRENMKNLHEIMQSFRFSNVCFWSYLTRTILEIILRFLTILKIILDTSYHLSIGLFLIYWCWGMPNLKTDIDCNVHGIR